MSEKAAFSLSNMEISCFSLIYNIELNNLDFGLTEQDILRHHLERHFSLFSKLLNY